VEGREELVGSYSYTAPVGSAGDMEGARLDLN